MTQTHPGSASDLGPSPVPLHPVQAEIHIAETVVGKVAAFYASQVPGVVALRGGLGQTVVKLVGRVLDQLQDRRGDLATDGVRVEVVEGLAKVEIGVVTHVGYPCLEVAQAIQARVGAKIRAHTGLAVVVSVNIIDIDLDGSVASS